MTKIIYKSKSPHDTQRIAAEILDEYPGRAVIALSGNLGTGKTVFVKGLALALGCKRPVTSPTFTLINEYPCNPPLYHADLYRLEQPGDADSLGLEEFMETRSIVAVEWPGKAPQVFPAHTIRVHIDMGRNEEDRVITVEKPD